jgi:hypothetical protein
MKPAIQLRESDATTPVTFWTVALIVAKAIKDGSIVAYDVLHSAFWAHVFLCYLTGVAAVIVWFECKITIEPANGRPIALSYTHAEPLADVIPKKKK